MRRKNLSIHCSYRRILRFLSDKRAVSNVISATIMVGTVITLGFAVLAWSQSVSSNYNYQFSQTVTAEVDRLKEKLVFEYIYYNSSSTPKKVSLYLLNSGTINNITILSVYISNSSGWLQSFSNPYLTLLNGSPASDQYIDMREERRTNLSLSTSLKKYADYSVRIVTGRGATFDSNFVA